MSDEEGEYTKFRAKVQLGDGPDQRGSIEVELQREPDEDREERFVAMPESATMESPSMDVEAKMNDAQFAEFYHELSRGTEALRQSLGLEEDDD